MITHERLLELVTYNPDTGVITSKVNRGSRCKVGKILGTKNAYGHLVLQLDKRVYLAHRLAWFYCFKEWPICIIDHIDRNPSNNSLDNLREATKATNNYNSKIYNSNTSGVKGAFFDKRRNLFYSQIVVNSKKIWLGYFQTLEEAGQAYNIEAKKLHGEFYNESAM